MKIRKFTEKNTVLCALAAFTAIMLLISLAFNIIRLDVSGVQGDVKLNANGFDMLSFSFTPVLYEALDAFLQASAIDAYGIVFGAISVAILVYSLFALVYAIVAFFFGKREKNSKALFAILLVALILFFAYSVVSIVFTIIANDSIPSDTAVKYKTAAFAGLIIQALCFTAYVVVSKVLKNNQNEDDCVEEKNEEVYKVGSIEEFSDIVDSLKQLMNVIRQYKKLYDDGVISFMDFSDKKMRMMKACRARTDRQAIAFSKAGTLKSYVDAENIISEILVECKALLTEEVLTDSEYVEWKTYFFTLIS